MRLFYHIAERGIAIIQAMSTSCSLPQVTHSSSRVYSAKHLHHFRGHVRTVQLCGVHLNGTQMCLKDPSLNRNSTYSPIKKHQPF